MASRKLPIFHTILVLIQFGRLSWLDAHRLHNDLKTNIKYVYFHIIVTYSRMFHTLLLPIKFWRLSSLYTYRFHNDMNIDIEYVYLHISVTYSRMFHTLLLIQFRRLSPFYTYRFHNDVNMDIKYVYLHIIMTYSPLSCQMHLVNGQDSSITIQRKGREELLTQTPNIETIVLDSWGLVSPYCPLLWKLKCKCIIHTKCPRILTSSYLVVDLTFLFTFPVNIIDRHFNLFSSPVLFQSIFLVLKYSHRFWAICIRPSQNKGWNKKCW